AELGSRGQALEHASHVRPMAVGAHFDAGARGVSCAPLTQRRNDLEELRVQGGLAPEQANPPPADSSVDRLLDEALDLAQRHVIGARCLLAGARTIEAAQVARVGDVDLY